VEAVYITEGSREYLRLVHKEECFLMYHDSTDSEWFNLDGEEYSQKSIDLWNKRVMDPKVMARLLRFFEFINKVRARIYKVEVRDKGHFCEAKNSIESLKQSLEDLDKFEDV